jgi:DNA helicase-2/ATP-dependent DNA helicase PcrA
VSDPQPPTLFDLSPNPGAPPPAGGAGHGASASFLEGLNPSQLDAVTHTGDHCLVLAGAGSGKTRVLTHRIAWLVNERGIDPAEICAVTFTNKAAAEMRGRVRRLLGRRDTDVWLSTFHSLGLRLLRELFNSCGRAVSRLEDPASWDAPNQSWDRKITGRIWKQYRAAMRAARAVDFDDLLYLPLHLMSHDTELRRRTAGRFSQLLIDEYQDTNRIQYRLIQALLSEGSALMVVGDEDQAIYRWRGADLNNVLDFQNDFPGATVVRLEQNYRSTQPILSAAGSLVANNRQRLGKSLWTEQEGGEVPVFVQCATDREEAEWVATKIEELGADPASPDRRAGAAFDGETAPLSDIAVLYRTNAQSRQFEEIFIGRRIPHRVVGGQRFFARREVRDILAYLQLLVRDDDVALRRAIGVPSRGIGPKTIEALANLAAESTAAASLRLLCAHDEPERAFAEAGFSPAAVERLLGFGRLLGSLREVAEANSTAQQAPGAGDSGLDALRSFLDRLALLADADTDREDIAGVRLMTVHAAKGLEFSVVFLAGMEEELFPHASSIADGDVEEERRLCYVGMTRARRRLMMSAARSRRINGRERWQDPSRFIGEIDPRHIVVRDYLSPKSVGSKDYKPSSFSGLGGRTGQRQRSRRGGSYGAARRGGGAGAKKGGAPAKFAAGQPTRAATETDLVDGAIVVHPMFGPGTITEATGSGDKLKLEIRFNKTGTKNVLAKFAKLEVPE